MERADSSLVDLLLMGELDAVSRGLEEGVYSWEELNLPHDVEGNTPLMSACQMGLNRVMHFLLERGADPTLCNHKNQTALHLSQPEVQDEMLAAIMKPLPHRTQLLKAAWIGDIHALQHLLTDSLDVNIQNHNGLTPLMLAVRDVYLFEGFQDTKGWDYNPVGVVKTLLALSANVDLQDQNGNDVLHYVSQIKSSIRDELLRIILESRSQDVFKHVERELSLPEEPCANSLSHSPDHGTPVASSTRNLMESFDSPTVQNGHKYSNNDKIIAFCFQSATEPRMSARQDLFKATGWTLASLREKDKFWTVPCTMHPTFDIPIKSSAVQSPRLTENNKTIIAPLAVPRLTQLSQSAPSLAPLDASFLLQVRANISNRLSGETSNDFNKLDRLPVLCRRVPKHLAPLDGGCCNGPLLSSLEHPGPPEPASILPLGSRPRRESYSRQVARGPRASRRGSQESNSSSGSSQSSLEVERDEKEIRPEEKGQVYNTFRRKHIPWTIEDKQITSTFKKRANFKDDTTELSEVLNNFERPFSSQEQECEPVDGHVQNEKLFANNHEHQNVEKMDRLAVGVKDKDIDPPLNIMLHPNPIKTSRFNKMTKRKCRSANQTQSPNLLAHMDTRREMKPTRNPLPQVIVRKIYLIDDITGEPQNALTIQDQNHKDTIVHQEAPGTLHYISSSGAKKTLRNSKNQKQLLNGDTKQRESKKTGIIGAQRAKSSLDHVSYRDMFLEIPQADEGPAIFEMFATPLYENVRVSSSADKNKPIQSAAPVKRKLNRQQRVPKSFECNRRKRTQKGTSAKGKQSKRGEAHPNGLQNQPQMVKRSNDLVYISAIGVKKPVSNTILNIEKKTTYFPDEAQSEQMLSMIEVLSEDAIREPIHNQPADLSTSFQSLRTSFDENISQKTKTKDFKDNGDDSVGDTFVGQPLINTWTGNRTQSPVYHKFLDDVGEGPVTDELLRCLAEELISLEEKEVDTLKTEKPEITNANAGPSEGILSSINLEHSERASVNNTIVWTKGEVLGRGAYGTVYCGLTNQGQLIAVKQVTLDVSSSETTEKEYNMLEQEVDLLKNLKHPNIVGFLGTGLSGNIISIFMEYIPGGSISNVLSRFGPLPEKVFELYTRQIIEGVVYLHANRVIHRDLKGNNIMLMPSGIIKLIDFGCARRLNFLTHSGHSDLLKSVHGTPYWMAPEVINETGHGKKSDVWSIGCTVFEMATGKPPLANMGKMAALFYIGAQRGSMPSLSDDFSEEAQGFVKACLINDQDQRPSAVDLLKHPFINNQLKTSKSSTQANQSNCS